MELTDKEIEQSIKENPNTGFDICSKCGSVQEYGTMRNINELEFDLVCNKCQ